MSKSLARVRAALRAAGIPAEPVESRVPTRTAAEAAAGIGVETDQIGKAIVFVGGTSGAPLLFLTAGSRRVDLDRAAALAGEALGRADAAAIRALTGFAIGGVAPLGATGPLRGFMDRRLFDFDTIWCAAGTPRHNFPAAPAALARATGAEIGDFARPAG
ncbi:YbaK/EbsC family protein [Palleronia sediminis]|uniref:YbaK/EbsC family protein n=1 Tax=Palleronia sediminis TaxID=2547833 RepID=A0A4R6ALY5_9RHOB|nr:YbaK/EbsC family protein [Palleronia sediminis]TDL84284.1 YbaK/EbsC family protein [Palleronia sediminis]